MINVVSSVDSDSRRYRMRKRLEDVADTRRRIVEATVDLHGSVGPANTTISAVAEKAGVQRSTVYRHFPDEEALFGACTSHWLAQHPWPRSEDWDGIADPAERTRRGLTDLYRYYEANERMLSNSLRDIELMPQFVGELVNAQVARIAGTLLDPWTEGEPDRRLTAAVTHAVDFRSWQSLEATGLSADEAANMMTSMVDAVATGVASIR